MEVLCLYQQSMPFFLEYAESLLSLSSEIALRGQQAIFIEIGRSKKIFTHASILARAKQNKHHKVRREQLSVREQMTHILRCLKDGEYVEFGTLFDVESGLSKLVVTFIAVLELAKEYLIEIQQSEIFGSIYVRTNRAITAE